jgi:anti-anti-sigma regulatory factor
MLTNNFTAHLQKTESRVGISLRGACTDTVAAQQLESAIQEGVATGLLSVWIDCQRLAPMTWHGQRAILNADRLARLNGVTLHWCGIPPAVLNQLATSGLNMLLHLQSAASYQGPALLLQDHLPPSTQPKSLYNK